MKTIEPIEPAVDALLTLAMEMALIEDYEKHRGSRTVRIRLAACETDLSFEESASFLAECIYQKLRYLQEEFKRATPLVREVEKPRADSKPFDWLPLDAVSDVTG